MTLTVFQKGVVLVVLPLLFQLAFVLVVVRFQRDQVEAEWWATHTKEVIAQAHEVHTIVSDAFSGVRGYVISRDPTFAEPYRRAIRGLPESLDSLAALVQDHPGQATLTRKLRSGAAALLDWQGEIVRLGQDGTWDEAITRIRSGRGNALQEEFRREIMAFLAEEERLNQGRALALNRSRERLNALFAIGGLLAVGGTLVLGYAFYRGIARRFAALEATVRRLAAGEKPPPPLAGGDEIARLDRAFREMAAEFTRAAEQVRDLYDNAPCGYHSVGPDGKVVAANRTELLWLGYEAVDVIGRMRFSDMVSQASQGGYRATFARVKEHGAAADIELELVRKDGTTFPVLLNSSAVRDHAGSFLRSRTTLTDLTERKRAEAALRLFADVAQNIPIGLLIYQLDETGDPPTLRVRLGNTGASRLLNFPLDQAAGRAVVEVFPAIPADQLRRYTQVAMSGQPDDLGEFQYGDDRVEERWWAVLAFPLPDRSVGVAFQDVSARKRAQAEVRLLNAELEERVRERTGKLEAANRDLLHKNTENEMFVYTVSHDLRSPLVNLQGFSKELEKGCQGLIALLDEQNVAPDTRARGRALLDGKMAKSIGFIRSAVLRLSGIIDALLRLSRAGRVEYRREAIDVGRVVGQVVRAAQVTIAERGATVHVGDLPAAWGDRTAIEQVFANLVGNALTYLDPSRPCVIEIGVLTNSDAGFRTYFVRDNGLGIAEGHRQKIFLAFQRAHPGIGTGEGLGLAIVARVIARHRGRVWVESQPGEGSTFYVTLPIPPETTDSQADGR